MNHNKTPVTALPGVGKVRAAALAKLGIATVSDLLYHFPRAYKNLKDVKTLLEALRYKENCAMVLTVGSYPSTVRLPGNKSMTKFTAFDDSGKITVCFFNQNYVKDIFKLGTAFRFWGKITSKNGKYFLSSPEFEPYSEKYFLPDYSPVYPLTEGITQKYLLNLIGIVLSNNTPLDDPIPEWVRKEYNLMPLLDAMRAIHRPRDYDELDRARERFIFEELYIYTLGLRALREKSKSVERLPMSRVDLKSFTSKLGFELTAAQKNAINEIYSDMVKSEYKMTRLLSGDVGSGKTVCAEAAAVIAMENGYQVCMMAPTEILANQHFNEMEPLFASLGYKTALLTGSLTQKQKREVRQRLREGYYQMAVGTHALITEDTEFYKLGLVITDEQHRFGVDQRAALSSKADGVHTLVMTATPIPRTLALILYGDLSVSSINEMPKGRQKIITYLVGENKRAGMYSFIANQLDMGRQCYIVCPAIEPPDYEDEGDLIDISYDPFKAKEESAPVKNVTEYYEELALSVFKNYRVGLIHGKMKAGDKDLVMRDFAYGDIRVLVSTTVIEVGVNVPNATCMVIENAERFGLSQLHQLRGRVGRGKHQSYCMLVSDTGENSPARERLTVMKNCSNGYEIAEYDLRQRGPGDFLADASGQTRQHGQVQLKMAALCDDIQLLAKATAAAVKTLELDPKLNATENLISREYMEKLFVIKNNTVN